MATRFFRAGQNMASVGSTRYLTINSSKVTRVFLSSGAVGISVFNQGSTPLIWGDSNITVNSGNYVFPLGRIEWLEVQDTFDFYLVSDSQGAFGIAAIQEYRNG